MLEFYPLCEMADSTVKKIVGLMTSDGCIVHSAMFYAYNSLLFASDRRTGNTEQDESWASAEVDKKAEEGIGKFTGVCYEYQ